jgi:formylglycine-generating enzyme required for sulfatase activity
MSDEPPGTNCSWGGLKLETGLDNNRNGSLDGGEAGTAEYICRDLSIFTNVIGQVFVKIPKGTFQMGSPDDELCRDDDETQHEVTLTQDFYMMTTEVTQGQWEAVMGMGSNPSHFDSCGDDCPVEQVSWDEAQSFINALNDLEDSPVTYSLPTEAQWEYAARAGTKTAFHTGSNPSDCIIDANLAEIGWYDYNSSDQTKPVASKQPNAWGLYDMSGNVNEWCQDWYDDTYPVGPVTDPTGPDSGSYRVYRGGSYYEKAEECRSANRSNGDQDIESKQIGFRLLAVR